MSLNSSAPTLPWYRHRWPWILIAGPAVVVVASMITLWLAITSADGLVTEDYYRKGLAINQTLASSERAQMLELGVDVSLTQDGISLRLNSPVPGFVLPQQIRVTISHPTRAGLDQTQLLTLADGRYIGKFQLPATGHWVVLVEDGAKSWRIMGNIVLPFSGETKLGITVPGYHQTQPAPVPK